MSELFQALRIPLHLKWNCTNTYEQAVVWMNANKPNDEFLRGLRIEAAALMGIEIENK